MRKMDFVLFDSARVVGTTPKLSAIYGLRCFLKWSTTVHKYGREVRRDPRKKGMELASGAGTETYNENDDDASGRSSARGRKMRLDLMSTTRIKITRSRFREAEEMVMEEIDQIKSGFYSIVHTSFYSCRYK